MIYIEMSIYDTHGGGTWAFPNCVWAPTEKENGSSWPFWRKILRVREGDTIIHLRGKTPKAYFVGYSTASSDGTRTTQRPPDSKKWNHATEFFRADLSGFTPFHKPINLKDLFSSRKIELKKYFDEYKTKRPKDSNIFYAWQSSRLQCLNGAYFSNVDEELLTALFGSGVNIITAPNGNTVVSVKTGSQIASVLARTGQRKFSDSVKKMYGNHCCFPGCNISDSRFLVGSHIARWSDNESLRGDMSNGLCFCLIHDKAFEIGYFTIDQKFKIYVNPKIREYNSLIVEKLFKYNGQKISLGKIKPNLDALSEHWNRIDIEP